MAAEQSQWPEWPAGYPPPNYNSNYQRVEQSSIPPFRRTPYYGTVPTTQSQAQARAQAESSHQSQYYPEPPQFERYVRPDEIMQYSPYIFPTSSYRTQHYQRSTSPAPRNDSPNQPSSNPSTHPQILNTNPSENSQLARTGEAGSNHDAKRRRLETPTTSQATSMVTAQSIAQSALQTAQQASYQARYSSSPHLSHRSTDVPISRITSQDTQSPTLPPAQQNTSQSTNETSYQHTYPSTQHLRSTVETVKPHFANQIMSSPSPPPALQNTPTSTNKAALKPQYLSGQHPSPSTQQPAARSAIKNKSGPGPLTAHQSTYPFKSYQPTPQATRQASSQSVHKPTQPTSQAPDRAANHSPYQNAPNTTQQPPNHTAKQPMFQHLYDPEESELPKSVPQFVQRLQTSTPQPKQASTQQDTHKSTVQPTQQPAQSLGPPNKPQCTVHPSFRKAPQQTSQPVQHSRQEATKRMVSHPVHQPAHQLQTENKQQAKTQAQLPPTNRLAHQGTQKAPPRPKQQSTPPPMQIPASIPVYQPMHQSETNNRHQTQPKSSLMHNYTHQAPQKSTSQHTQKFTQPAIQNMTSQPVQRSTHPGNTPQSRHAPNVSSHYRLPMQHPPQLDAHRQPIQQSPRLLGRPPISSQVQHREASSGNLSGFSFQPKNPTDKTFLKGRADIVQLMKEEDATEKMVYDPKTIARDVLIASGRHPTEPALNHHLLRLRDIFSFVDISSDLTTFRWDLVDPKPSRDQMQNQQISKPSPPKAQVAVQVVAPSIPTTTSTQLQFHHPQKPQQNQFSQVQSQKPVQVTVPKPQPVSQLPAPPLPQPRVELPDTPRKNMQNPRRPGRPPGSSNKPKVVVPALDLPYSVFSCKWGNCQGELHNLDTLKKHIFKVHVSYQLTCGWKGCTFTGTLPAGELFKHVKKEHLEPVAWNLGDGPSVPTSDRELSTTALSIPETGQPGSQDSLIFPASYSSVRAFNRVHGNHTQYQKAHQILKAVQRLKGNIGIGLDPGGCELATPSRNARLSNDEEVYEVRNAS